MARKRKVVLEEYQLAELVKTRDHSTIPYLRERAAAIIKVAEGLSVRQVAALGLLKKVRRETVSEWIDRYEEEGLEGLRIRPGRGRKPAFSSKHESIETASPELQGMVHRSPYLYGFNCSTWTLEMIREKTSWLNGEGGGKKISIPGVSKILKRLNVCYKRGKAHVHSPDRNYNKKMAIILHAHLLNLLDPKRFPLLYEDELTYYRLPRVGKVWGSKGEKGALRAKEEEGHDTAGRIAACIDVQTGEVISRQRSSYPVKEMYRFFYYVEQHYLQAERIFLVLDNWPNHFHNFVKENLARGAKKIVLLPLPTYAPWENPTEKLWLKLKRENIVHHPFGGNWAELKKTIGEWLEQYRTPSPDVLHFVGLDTKMERYRALFASLQEQEKTHELLVMTDLLPV